MSKTYVQPGEIMDYLNSSGSDIAVGAVVIVGTRVGVAETLIPNGQTGSVRVWGVVKLAKATGAAIAQGALVYWSATNFSLSTTSSSNTLAGYAFNAAASADATMLVKLNA